MCVLLVAKVCTHAEKYMLPQPESQQPHGGTRDGQIPDCRGMRHARSWTNHTRIQQASLGVRTSVAASSDAGQHPGTYTVTPGLPCARGRESTRSVNFDI